MSLLHTINKSYDKLDVVLATGDVIIFTEDGVYNCLPKAFKALLDNWQHMDIKPPPKVYILKADAIARGVSEAVLQIDNGVEAIDYQQFVQLCTEYDNVISWF